MSGQVYGVPFATIPEWILDAEISDRAVRVFCVLNRYADTRGYAFPGRAAMAKRCICSTASLDRALNELRGINAVVSRQKIVDGAIVGNDYWLWPSSPESMGSPTGEATPSPTGEARVGAPVMRQERKPLNESHKTLPAPLVLDVCVPDLFDRFWELYPKKLQKPVAKAAWVKAIRKTDPAHIVAMVDTYQASVASRMEAKFIPYPQKWLNQEMWNDVDVLAKTGGTGSGIAGVADRIAARRAAETDVGVVDISSRRA